MIKILSKEVLEDIRLSLNSIFYSVQGEGKYLGIPTLFFRFNTCNLTCNYCDTEFEDNTIEDIKIMTALIKNYITEYPIKQICFTGGEPLLFLKEIKNIIFLIHMLRYNVYDVKVETNGTIPLPETIPFANRTIYTISPKLEYFDKIYGKFKKPPVNTDLKEVIFKFMVETDAYIFKKTLNKIYLFLSRFMLSAYNIYFSPINESTDINDILESYRRVYDNLNNNFNHKLITSIYMDNFKGITFQLHKLLEWK
ncbi:hypothetical protein LCGC14_1335850 [marine sediment metagenome]|uniref:Radical SAM core domain-containing protein n=1 Tax=marine sediment metagenome TaxID=412755 RepID=A0A0F9KF55_9ZZZZ